MARHQRQREKLVRLPWDYHGKPLFHRRAPVRGKSLGRKLLKWLLGCLLVASLVVNGGAYWLLTQHVLYENLLIWRIMDMEDIIINECNIET